MTERTVVGAPPPATPRRPAWRLFHASWGIACLTALGVLIGARWLRYTSWSAVPWVDHVLREIMVVDTQSFLWTWAYTTARLPTILLAVAVVIAGLHRRLPGRLVHRAGDAWRLTPLGLSLVLGAMPWVHYLFDLNPTVAAACGTSLALAWCTRAGRPPTSVLAVIWALFFVGWVAAAADWVDRLTILVWAGYLLATHRLLARRIGGVELALARVVAIIPMNLLAAALPLVLPLHGGTLLGAGLGYSFCEVPNRGSLYATVPVCNSVRHGYEDCRDGHVAEYDLASMKPIATHRFFDRRFYGRLELMVCLPDEIQVVVQGAVSEGQSILASVLSFPVAAPAKFNPLFTRDGLGVMVAYDEAHDALFYSAEFDDLIVRYDRRTRRFDRSATPDVRHDWVQPVALQPYHGSLSLHTAGIHPGRNRLYGVEWMQGRYAYAIDTTTFRRVARYDVGSGGALAAAVDAERDRLFVSSIWGLEVFDLATDTLIARRRMGLGNRPVVVDRARNRLYLSSTVEGKIRVLDRDTLELIDQIPIGLGTRYPYLSRDGKYLFASSETAHYYWNADDLARRR